jgi:NAD(P)-dependent dehydrogenase (short-subunit alcohol dehydrogenase family)
VTGNFANQVGLVTGASSGIGRAIALALAADGASLSLVGRNLEALEIVAHTARKTAARVHCYRADLSVDADVRALAARVERDHGRLDLLILSAGIIALGRMDSAPVEDFDRQYRINVRAPYLLTQTLLPLLRDSQGQIVFINTSSVDQAAPEISRYTATKQALKTLANILRNRQPSVRDPLEFTNSSNSGRPEIGLYAATKQALKAIADTLREEMNGQGIRVLSVYPGPTASNMQASIHQTEGLVYHPENLLQPEEVAAAVVQALSLPRSVQVTNISGRVLTR